MTKLNLPSISDVNSAKGAEVREMYERVFDETTTSKDTNALKAKIIAKLKEIAKDAKKAATAPKDDRYATTERAAFDAEKQGEWLTAALAWESAAKMLPDGPGKTLALDRAAAARVNAAKPDTAPAGTSADDATKAAEKKAKAEADAKAKAEAKAAKEAEKKAKAEADAAAKAAAKAEKEAQAKQKAAEKEAAALAAKAEKEEKAKALAAEREAKKQARIAEREAKKAAKGDGKKGDEPFAHDERIAHLVGQTITHTTKNGVTYEIKVLPDGFEYKGEHYKSLSAVGRFVNGGKSTNGFVFFGLSTLPRPELKDTDAVIAGFDAARHVDGLTDLKTILDGSVPEAHEHHAAILEAAEKLEASAKALRLGAKLIEAKKGRPVAAQ